MVFDVVELLYLYAVKGISQERLEKEHYHDFGLAEDEIQQTTKEHGFNRKKLPNSRRGYDLKRYAYLEKTLKMSKDEIKKLIAEYAIKPHQERDNYYTFEDYLASLQITPQSSNATPIRAPRPQPSQPLQPPPSQMVFPGETQPSMPRNFPQNAHGNPKGGSAGKSKAIALCLGIAVVIIAVVLLRGSIGKSPLNAKNAVNEIQYFTPVLLSGLTVGEMFNGICTDPQWSTYEVAAGSGAFSGKTVWVRFAGSSGRGAVNASFTLTKDRILDYTCHVDGNPMPLDQLYAMFHDPDYDKKISAALAEAENQDKFDDAEERISKISLVHDYAVPDFNDLTILEFIDSICVAGDWSSNDKTANLRVIFDGQSDSGAVQAIFDVDENEGIVEGSWYFNSKEIEARDLYLLFYPE